MYNQRANNIILYCNSFENLKEFDFQSENEIINLNNIPFFDKDCNIIFNSLTHFKFSENSKYVMNIDILNNLYNNIDKMPKLKSFYLYCFINDIEKNFYMEFIQKILSLGLEYIKVSILNNNYSNEILYIFNKLKNLFHNLKVLNYEKIFISKFNNSLFK